MGLSLRSLTPQQVPPSLVLGQAPPPTDRRPEYVGAVEAGEILGVKRTQVFRPATQSKVLPYEVFGSGHRKEYKFRRADVVDLRRKRDEQARIAATRRSTKKRVDASTSIRLAKAMLSGATEINLAAFMREVARSGSNRRAWQI